MKTRLTMAGVALAALVASMIVSVPSAQALAPGFSISGRNLVDVNGNVFIMRGTSHPDVWFSGERASYAELAGLGSNAVRVVLGSGQRAWGTSTAADVTAVINLCKANRLICMLEVHDTTGFGEQAGAASLDQAVTYWDSIRSAIVGQEAYVLINIGNEPIGNNNPAQWTAATVSAVQRMRTLGFTHTLVVDAPNWGQDWTNTMRANAMQVWNADTLRNTLFSIHMYEVYGTASAITTYFDAFAQMNLPLIVGEFGFGHNGQNVDEDTIMAEAQARGIGWLAWSYSGNSDGLLDQATGFNPAQLTTWGTRVFNGVNGVRQTARCATVFTGCGPGGNPPAAPAGLTVSGTTSSSVSLSWTASSGATQYQVQRAAGACSGTSSFAQIGTSTTTSFTNTALPASTSFCYRVTASNTNGTSGPSNTVTGTTMGGGGTPPAAPAGLTVSGTTSSSVSLSWTASSGATQYQVQRAAGACSASSSFSQVGTSTTPSFINGGLAASTSFCYRVTASNTSGTSGPSNTVTGTTTGGGTGGCSAVGTVQSQWGNGYVVQPTTVTNTGTSSITGWRVTFTLPAGHSIAGSWNATLSGTTGTITATNMGYNGNLGAGASTSFGFQVSRPNGNTQTPSGYTCAVG